MPQFIYLGLIFLVMTLLSLVFAALNAIKGDNNLIMIFSLVILLGILILVADPTTGKIMKRGLKAGLKNWIRGTNAH